MSISSISSSDAYWELLAKKASAKTSAATLTTTAAKDDSASSEKTSSSTNKQDSFAELMSMLSAMSATYAGNTQTNTGGESSSDSDLRSFLDKVKAGTVTSEDLKNMQDLLASGPTASSQSTSTSNDFDSNLTSFLDKVKNGTVTTDDLTSLQALLVNGAKPLKQDNQDLSQQLLALAANSYENDYQSVDSATASWKV